MAVNPVGILPKGIGTLFISARAHTTLSDNNAKNEPEASRILKSNIVSINLLLFSP